MAKKVIKSLKKAAKKLKSAARHSKKAAKQERKGHHSKAVRQADIARVKTSEAEDAAEQEERQNQKEPEDDGGI